MAVNVHNDAAGWATALLRTLLDSWLVALDDTGLFHPYFDRQWRRIEAEPRTLVSQCRLIYNFCRGYEVYADGRYAAAAGHGLSALQTYFRVSPGRYRWAVDQAGAESDPTLDAYGHAFCVLALATKARVFDDAGAAAQAREAWETLTSVFADSHGGLMWYPKGRNRQRRSQNPIMHSFEALIALQKVDRTGFANAETVRLLAFAASLSDFPEGRLVEHFTADWRPLPPEQGGTIELGHACEWALLLSDWHAVTGEAALLETGSAFLRTGLEWGLDTDGGLRDSCDPSGRIVTPGKGLWQQCEAIRAVSRYATGHDQTHLRMPLQRLCAFFKEHFIDPEFGGVFVSPEGVGHGVSLDKGHAWKLDYHTVNMCLELLGRGN